MVNNARGENLNMKNEKIILPEYVTEVMERMMSEGEEIYIVGGSLRDILLGKVPSDYDMTTSATPERVCEIFCDHRVIKTGIAHGTQTVLSHGNPIEITTYRVDGNYLDSRRPESVSFTRSLSEDLARRDFTVNAMAYNPKDGFVDLYGGEDDLKEKVIKAVGEPKKRFCEDALRIMRAFRFSAQLGFEIEKNTLLAAIECKERLANISKERIGNEFIRLICSDSPAKSVKQMRDSGILDYVIGDFAPSDKAIELLSSVPKNDTARLACLLFDADEEQVKKALSMLKCSNKQKTGCMATIGGAKRRIESRGDAARMRADVREFAEDAVKLSVLLGISPDNAIKKVRLNDAPRSVSELQINGSELAELGLCGKEIGKMLEYLFEAALDNPMLNEKTALKAIAKDKIEKEKGNKNARD